MYANSSKINWGTFAKIPEISVDRFCSIKPQEVNLETTRAFFLTHYDNEICKDVLSITFLDILSNPESISRLYLHRLAFEYLKYWATTKHIQNGENIVAKLDELNASKRIILLETNSPIRLEFETSEYAVVVTAISSGSNIGCIMLLFEVQGNCEYRILHTGDCRVTLKDLQNNPVFHNKDGSVKKIDKLYLDTTFCVEDAKELPARNDVTNELLKRFVIEKALISPSIMRCNINTELEVCNIAFLQRLASKAPNGLHTPAPLADFLKQIPALKNSVHSDNRRGRIHILHYNCDQNCDCDLQSDQDPWNPEAETINMELGCLFPYHYEFPRVKCSRDDQCKWLKNGKKVYYNTHQRGDLIRGIYAFNLSRFEMGRLINYFGLDPEYDVLPLHKSPQMSPLQMQILLEIGCADGRVEPACLKRELPSYCYDFTSICGNFYTDSFKDLRVYRH